MGEVWRAEDTVLSRTVAVKVLKSELTQERTFLERFRTEARTTASLQANGIANVFDYGEVATGDDIPVAYLVMEYVDGEPLSAQLARDGRLPAARVLEIIRQAALALAEAHRVGMVHRDVKPGNLLVRRSDGAVKITDFGIARAADAVPLTQNGMVVGTAQYFSPEQAEGRVVGPPSDVYSLGVVAYECLAGRLPFLADSPVTVAMMQIRDVPPALPPDVPGPVQALVMRILAKDPRQRFADGAELAEAVRAVQEGRPIPSPRPFPTPPPAPQPGPAQPSPAQPSPGQLGLAQPGLAQPGLAQAGPAQPVLAQPGPRSPVLGGRVLRSPVSRSRAIHSPVRRLRVGRTRALRRESVRRAERGRRSGRPRKPAPPEPGRRGRNQSGARVPAVDADAPPPAGPPHRARSRRAAPPAGRSGSRSPCCWR